MGDVVRPDTARIKSGDLKPGVYLYQAPSNSERFWIDSIEQLEGKFFKAVSGNSLFESDDLSSIAVAGDLLMVGRGVVRILLSQRNRHNTILVTEECDNLCQFCSQPPKETAPLYGVAQRALANYESAGVVGITGGEPTSRWAEFRSLLSTQETWREGRELHVLSHGRNFRSHEKVRQLVSVPNAIERTLYGIPIHGHVSALHDLLTRVPGSYEQTLDGALNMAYVGAALEIRIVVNSKNSPYLSLIVESIISKLRGSKFFIAVMQLEPVGWANNNFKHLFSPTKDHLAALSESIALAEAADIGLRLYNYPLCELSNDLRPYAVQSVSDWKNYFHEDCRACNLKPECAGFFKSAARRGLIRVRPEL